MSEFDEYTVDPLNGWTRLDNAVEILLAEGTRDADTSAVWDGNVTPVPLGPIERDALRALAQVMRAPGALGAAIARYVFVEEAYGLGLGMDPDIVAGVRLVLEALRALAMKRRSSVVPRARRRRHIEHVRPNRGRFRTETWSRAVHLRHDGQP